MLESFMYLFVSETLISQLFSFGLCYLLEYFLLNYKQKPVKEYF